MRTNFLLWVGSGTGEAAGEGYNLNLPMPKGTAWNTYHQSLQTAIDGIHAYQPDILVVSLGVDTFKDDPVGGFALESDDYLKIGEMIASSERPTHFIMEGGYAMSALGTNVANIITAFSSSAG